MSLARKERRTKNKERVCLNYCHTLTSQSSIQRLQHSQPKGLLCDERNVLPGVSICVARRACLCVIHRHGGNACSKSGSVPNTQPITQRLAQPETAAEPD